MKRLRIKDLPIGMVLREISLAKNNIISIAEFKSLYEGDKTMLKVADIYETYDREKSKKLFLDFDDLLVETHRLLSENDEVRDKYRGTFRHVIVDEYQDTNPVQMEILKILVNEIRELVDSNSFKYTDIAVIYRCNFQSRVIEEAFSQHKIPYHIENGLCFYDRREVKILLDYLRLIANPLSDEGDEALRNIINIPNRYLGRTFMADLDSFQSSSNTHLYDKLKSMPIDLPYIRKNVREFIQFIDPLIEDSAYQQPTELIQLIRSALDYDRYITDDDLPSPDDVKIENLNQLAMAAARINDIRSFLDLPGSTR